MVKMLLDMGAHSGCTDPQVGRRSGVSPGWASGPVPGYLPARMALFGAGANAVLLSQDGTSPLYWAACCGFANVASLLLQRGAPATAKDVEG